MKKLLMSLMVLAIIATPLTLARPHYNSTTAGTAADGTIRNNDAKNYQNLKGNYKATPTTAGATAADGTTVRGAATNNLKSNFNRGADGTAATTAGAAPSRRR